MSPLGVLAGWPGPGPDIVPDEQPSSTWGSGSWVSRGHCVVCSAGSCSHHLPNGLQSRDSQRHLESMCGWSVHTSDNWTHSNTEDKTSLTPPCTPRGPAVCNSKSIASPRIHCAVVRTGRAPRETAVFRRSPWLPGSLRPVCRVWAEPGPSLGQAWAEPGGTVANAGDLPIVCPPGQLLDSCDQACLHVPFAVLPWVSAIPLPRTIRCLDFNRLNRNCPQL